GKKMADCMCGEKSVSRNVYACGGCADVGELSDQVSRQLRKDGFAQSSMSCITGIAAHMKPFIDAAKKMDEVIVIDGCPVLCARKVMEHAEIPAKSYVLTEMGLEKGKTTVTPELIADICQRIKG
ncbi:MAG TPA: putative zinc-binding protein, partial [Patescibacteria group bacterium]|nr:putative zinc-binding protein [Patescibacteria group bacterium]